jgi:diguanylate cyclase (GGDEF)-like protein/hemerythrin-like metal-binding protein/PAS domain S-box-containing protein
MEQKPDCRNEAQPDVLDHYRLLAEQAAEYIWLFDWANQRYKYVSPSVRQLRGLTVAEAMQEKLEDSLHPESQAMIRGLVDRFAESPAGGPNPAGTIPIEAISQYRRDNEIIQVETAVHLIPNSVTGSVDILGISRDIAGRQQQEALLDREICEKNAVILDLQAAQARLAGLTEELLSKNAALRKMAQTDELTGLNNRYYFDRRIDEEIERAERYATPMSLLLIDLDHFKQVNDTWGHDLGDQVLIHIAAILQKQIRRPDILARWGGEEFILLATQTALPGGIVLADKLREAISSHPFEDVGQVTASFGIAERLGGESYGSWFRRADQALYQAKNLGRNRVVSSSNEERSPIAQVRLEWKAVWNSGNPVIDSQHREMMILANNMIDLSLKNLDNEVLNHALQILIDHITRHFADEEKILEQIDYPETGKHSSLHRSLIRRLQRLNNSVLRTEPKPSMFFAFIMDEMIVGHMLTEDVLFFPYIRIQGGGMRGSQVFD